MTRLAKVVERLEGELPHARIALRFADELQLLVSVMLSAQCTDVVVNQVTPALFAKYRTAADYAKAPVASLERAIRRVGLFRMKARNLKAAMQLIVAEHGGQVPRTREALAELPGVGWKTAGVVANNAFGEPAFAVDTHVGRIARRLGITRQEDPRKVELALTKQLPPATWGRAHHLFIWHGRRTCVARKPHCSRCVVADLCPKRGVTERD